MSHTLKSVLDQLGDAAQLAGGRIVVYKDGKHIDVGGISPDDAVFTLTAAGKKLLEGEDGQAGEETQKKGKKGAAKPAKPAEPETGGDDNLNLDLDLS